MSASTSIVNKINFTFSQLISSGLFLGYSVSHRNPYINYFLLGRRLGVNLFNLNLSYFSIKKFLFILKRVLLANGRTWIVNEKFPLFNTMSIAGMLNACGVFQIKKWRYGLLTNRKNVTSNLKFPHLVFVTNSFQNLYISNEAFLLNIPAVGLVDSSENPLNYLFPIPGNSKSLTSVYFFYLLIFRLVKISRYKQRALFHKKSFGSYLNSQMRLTSKYLLNYCSFKKR